MGKGAGGSSAPGAGGRGSAGRLAAAGWVEPADPVRPEWTGCGAAGGGGGDAGGSAVGSRSDGGMGSGRRLGRGMARPSARGAAPSGRAGAGGVRSGFPASEEPAAPRAIGAPRPTLGCRTDFGGSAFGAAVAAVACLTRASSGPASPGQDLVPGGDDRGGGDNGIPRPRRRLSARFARRGRSAFLAGPSGSASAGGIWCRGGSAASLDQATTVPPSGLTTCVSSGCASPGRVSPGS
jgi:hypothetical protein